MNELYSNIDKLNALGIRWHGTGCIYLSVEGESGKNEIEVGNGYEENYEPELLSAIYNLFEKEVSCVEGIIDYQKKMGSYQFIIDMDRLVDRYGVGTTEKIVSIFYKFAFDVFNVKSYLDRDRNLRLRVCSRFHRNWYDWLSENES